MVSPRVFMPLFLFPVSFYITFCINDYWFSRDVRKKLKLKILSFYLYQVKVIFKHVSVGLSSAR